MTTSFTALAIERAGAAVRKLQKTVESVAADEVLVRVDHASINSMDAGLSKMNVFQLPEPYVLGFDFSGEVLATGEQVFGRVGRGGAFAEMAVAKKDSILPRGAIPAAEASCYGIAYLTAYESLVMTAEIEKHAGKWIFVPGAGGGVGHFAAQLAKLFGLRVIGSAGKSESLRVLEALKLDAMIDYSQKEVVAEVLRITGGKGADLVYDSTYKQSSYAQSAKTIAAGGEYTRLGTPTQLARVGAGDVTAEVESRGAKMRIGDLGRYAMVPEFAARLPEVMAGQKRAIGWYEEGKVRPIITQTIPFDAAALQQALQDFGAGKNNAGKVIVKVR